MNILQLYTVYFCDGGNISSVDPSSGSVDAHLQMEIPQLSFLHGFASSHFST